MNWQRSQRWALGWSWKAVPVHGSMRACPQEYCQCTIGTVMIHPRLYLLRPIVSGWEYISMVSSLVSVWCTADTNISSVYMHQFRIRLVMVLWQYALYIYLFWQQSLGVNYQKSPYWHHGAHSSLWGHWTGICGHPDGWCSTCSELKESTLP